EGIYAQRQSFERSALNTFRRYALPAAAGQATTILALAPLMAISGVAGKFIRVLPVTAIACLAMAFVIALLVDLPLSRFLLKPPKAGDDKQLLADRIAAGLSERLKTWSLRTSLKSRKLAFAWVAGAFVIFVLSFLAFTTTSIIMYPASDG